MSASPSCSPPRRPLHERSTSQHNRLQIRVVPYSPPRLSSDGSTRVVSYADASTETDPEPLGKYSSPLAQTSPRHSLYQDAPSPTLSSASSSKPRATVARLKRPPNFIRPSSTTDSWRSDALYTPRNLSEEPSSPIRPSSRRKVINVHSDKTFSVHPQSRTASLKTEERSFRSRPSDTTGSSSYGRTSSAAFTEDRPSSPLTPLTERSLRSYSPASFETPGSSASPWNYRMIGGLRKVRKTPDLRRDQSQTPSPTPPTLPLPPLPPLPALTGITPPTLDSVVASQSLAPKTSFQSAVSSRTASTLSDCINWKAYGQSSPVNATELESLPPSSIHSNYEVHGEPSSSDPSVHVQTRPQTVDSEANIVVHHGPASSTSSVVGVKRRVRSEYSCESLVVPPLRPTKRSSSENFRLLRSRSRSRDSVRTGSLTSLSNALTQEATRALFVGPPVLLNHGGMSWQDSLANFSSSTQGRSHQATGNPYRWSAQLSTVMSESEGGSVTISRPLSPANIADRRSSGFHSNHSRHILSMASSLGGLDELTTGAGSHSRHGSIERPPAVHVRNGSRDHGAGNIRLIRDQDEDGDGLADLEVLRHRSSQRRLATFLSSYASDRSLRSTASSRANSFSSRSIPAWARLYYGSGERRFLAAQPSSDSMRSQYSEGLTPSPFMSRSPSQDRSPPNIYVPRRRPQEQVTQIGRDGSNRPSLEIAPLSSHPVMNVVRTIKKQTSSIWSPHLGRDRRAARFSMWEPPAAAWSAESELSGNRNSQIVLFVVGFIFPLAWMVAACLPLTHPADLEAATAHELSTSNFDLRQKPSYRAPSVNESVYHSARWWRNVNRIMSIIGLLVLGAVIALIVVGVRQRW